MKRILIALASLVSTAQAGGDGKCRVLALSSGDESAAYQAGALSGIASSSHMQPKDYAYDSVSGISGGAINAVLLANFTKGEEAEAAESMKDFWRAATKTTLYKNWFGGITRGLFFEGGLYNSAPMEDFIKTRFENIALKRMMDIGITDVKDGSYRDFSDLNITSTPASNTWSSWLGFGKKSVTNTNMLAEALYASMSIAGFFPPADVLGSYYFDGSAVWDIDIFSAINRCVDQGFKNSDIIVDVIMTSSAGLKQVQAEDYKSIQMLFRYLEISSFYNSMDGLLRARFAYEGVKFRCVITPSDNIPSSLFPMNMNTKQIEAAFALGSKDAQTALERKDQSGACANSVDDVIQYHALKKRGDQRMMKHTFGSFLEAKKNGEFEEYNIYDDIYMKHYTMMGGKK